MHSQSRIQNHTFTIMHSQSRIHNYAFIIVQSAGARPGLAGDAFTVCDSGVQPGQLVQLAHFLTQKSIPQDVHCET